MVEEVEGLAVRWESITSTRAVFQHGLGAAGIGAVLGGLSAHRNIQKIDELEDVFELSKRVCAAGGANGRPASSWSSR